MDGLAICTHKICRSHNKLVELRMCMCSLSISSCASDKISIANVRVFNMHRYTRYFVLNTHTRVPNICTLNVLCVVSAIDYCCYFTSVIVVGDSGIKSVAATYGRIESVT